MNGDVRTTPVHQARKRRWLTAIVVAILMSLTGLLAMPAVSLAEPGTSDPEVTLEPETDESPVPASEESQAPEGTEDESAPPSESPEDLIAAEETETDPELSEDPTAAEETQTDPELPEAPAAVPADPAPSETDLSMGPMAVPDFASQTDVVYTLDRYTTSRTTGWLFPTTYTTPAFRIRQLRFDENTNAVERQSPVMGGPRVLNDLEVVGGPNDVKALNSLGVTTDGVFYFTAQQGTDTRLPRVDIWKYEMTSLPGPGNPQGTAHAPVRVVTNLSLNSTGGGTIVGGAVNPRDGAYYFMYFSGTSSSSPLGAGHVRAHLYRYYPDVVPDGSPQVGEVAHIDIRKHTSFGTTFNGDIAFDTLGNLHLVVSNNGATNSRGRAMIATLDFAQFSTLPNIQYTNTSSPAVPTLLPTSTLGAGDQAALFNTSNGSGYNGLAFTASGKAVVQQGDSVRLADPSNFNPLGGATAPTGITTLVDLASASSPPVLTVQKVVDGERFAPGDQFTLRAEQELATAASTSLGTVTTTGSAPGLQPEQIGPQAMQAGGTIRISEEIPSNAANYSTSYECFVENPGGSSGPVFASGIGTEIVFSYLNDVPGAATGPQQMKCVFTNGPLRADLQTAKSVVPESGTVVDAGDVVQFRLDFDNTAGEAPATEVDYTDHLADVLDDADFVAGSIRYGDGTETGYPGAGSTPIGLTAAGPAGDQLTISGTVPTGERRTVWFEVRVKDNSADTTARTASDSSTTGYLLANILRPTGEQPPEECVQEDPNCTVNPVSAWTVEKSSVPADGSLVSIGDHVHYRVELTKLHGAAYSLQDVRLTDDLTDVLAAAHWVAEPDSVPAGARARGIYLYDAAGDLVGEPVLGDAGLPKPVLTPGSGSAPTYGSAWTLTSTTFHMPQDAVRAELWYAVEAGAPPQVDGQWEPPAVPQKGTTFTNRVVADSSTQPPLRCAPGDGQEEVCQVTHTIESSFFTVRKDGLSADGTTTGLSGHRFELRDDVAGAPSASRSTVLCDDGWDQQPDTSDIVDSSCARLYPIVGGDLDGEWRAQNVPPGTYWLVETKAPAGYQLLAEPIRFQVASADASLTVLDGTGATVPRCDDGDAVACVDESGYVITITDPKVLALPAAGGFGPHWFAPIGAVLVLTGLAVAVWYRRRGTTQEAVPYDR